MANKSAKFIMIAILCSFLFTHTLLAKDKNILRIGIIIDGPWQRNIEYVENRRVYGQRAERGNRISLSLLRTPRG